MVMLKINVHVGSSGYVTIRLIILLNQVRSVAKCNGSLKSFGTII